MVVIYKRILTISGMALVSAALIAAVGCGKKAATDGNEIETKLKAAVEQMQTTKKPYAGNLTPEKSAEITHEVSAKSMSLFPAGDAMPKEPQELLKINDRIKAETDKVYAKYNTSATDMMTFISDMSPKQREVYNNKLTELFLEESKKKYGSEKDAAAAGQPAAPKQEPAAPAAPVKK